LNWGCQAIPSRSLWQIADTKVGDCQLTKGIVSPSNCLSRRDFRDGRESRIGSYGIEWIRHTIGIGGGVSRTRCCFAALHRRSSLLREKDPVQVRNLCEKFQGRHSGVRNRNVQEANYRDQRRFS